MEKPLKFRRRLFFFFGEHLISDGKTVEISEKTFFFGEHLILDEKNVEVLEKTFF